MQVEIFLDGQLVQTTNVQGSLVIKPPFRASLRLLMLTEPHRFKIKTHGSGALFFFFLFFSFLFFSTVLT
jgi:hypothetical protein